MLLPAGRSCHAHSQPARFWVEPKPLQWRSIHLEPDITSLQAAWRRQGRGAGRWL